MLISCNALKKYLKDSDKIDFLKVWDTFTIRTAEVESVVVKGNQFDGVVTAKILDVQNHPESKKLHILKVDVGDEKLQIVCGAPNVRVGLVGACIKVGGHIDGMEIKVRPLAGIASHGMMCSGAELGISDDNSGILELSEDSPIGVDIKELLPVEDIIVDIDNKSLTHRPDLWGHYGIAREISAITHHELLPLELNTEVSTKKDLSIKINNPELCYRYIGTKLDNIKNNVTPMWMQIFLYYAGMRSINLIVDLTNYIMLELGQPMHAFDSRVVKNIEVGLANDGDTFVTLDNVQRTLTKDDLMIKNGGKYFAIAGVMGGLNSEIVEDTSSIILESACFEAYTVRKTAISLGLRTEASARYEKSLDPNMAIIATNRFIKLLKDENPNLLYGSNITDVYPTIQNENHITLNKDYLYKYMGFEIDDKQVLNILNSLDFKVKNLTKKFEITVPTYRSTKDITLAADIIEEISRMYGYENFEHIPLKTNMTFGNHELVYDTEYEVKNFLASKYNLHEIHSYLWNKTSFLKKLNIELDNVKLLGKNEDNVLRDSLDLSLLENSVVNNKNYDEYGLFEIGTVIKNNECKRELSVLLVKNSDNLKVGYYQIKDIIYNLFNSLKNIKIDFVKNDNVNSYYNDDLSYMIMVDDYCIGFVNVFNKRVSNLVNKKKVFISANIDFDSFVNLTLDNYIFKDVSKYPTTTLDYTILTKRGSFYKDLEIVLDGFKSPIILKRELLDIYLENDIKKVSIRYTVGSDEKTLTSNELDDFKNKFIEYLENNDLGIIY